MEYGIEWILHQWRCISRKCYTARNSAVAGVSATTTRRRTLFGHVAETAKMGGTGRAIANGVGRDCIVGDTVLHTSVTIALTNGDD